MRRSRSHTSRLLRSIHAMNSLFEISSDSPELTTDPLKMTLPDLLKSRNAEGLAQVPTEALQRCVRPVLESLQKLDAESLLELQRTPNGAVLGEG